MDFEYSLNYFNYFDKLIYQKNSSVLDVAYKLRKEPDYIIQKLSKDFIKYIMYLIVLNIFNEKNEYDRKYLKEEKNFINDFLNDDNRLDRLYSVDYINIINNYLPYRKIYSPVKISYAPYNKLIVDESAEIYLNLFNYYSVLLNYNINYCYYLRILTVEVNQLYAQYYLIILFTLWNNANKGETWPRENLLINEIINFLKDNFNEKSKDRKLLRYCYFKILDHILNNSKDFFLDYLNNINDIIFEINNLVSNYLNSKGANRLKILINNLERENPIAGLNENIWEILKKNDNIKGIGKENFDIEIKNMLKELINLLRNSKPEMPYDDKNYKSYIENFSTNFFNDFSLNKFNLDVKSFDNIINKNYKNILIDLENDYYIIYLNLLDNLELDKKEISVSELYYNLEDMKFNNYLDENLLESENLNQNAIFFFNNYILISSKIDYIKGIPFGIDFTTFDGNEYNIKNLSYKDNKVYSDINSQNRISGITAFSSFSFTNPELKNIFFNNYRASDDNSIESDIEKYLKL